MNQVVCEFFAIHGLALPNAKLTGVGNSGCQLESFPEWSKVATKGGFFSESGICFSNLQISKSPKKKYSKKLS